MSLFFDILQALKSRFLFPGLAAALKTPEGKAIFGDGAPPADFAPDKPQSEREFLWSVRNPFQGVTEAVTVPTPYTTEGPTVTTITPHGQTWKADTSDGLNWLIHTSKEGVKYPFVSNRSGAFEMYLGWRPDGKPGLAFRNKKARGF
jgi:hypothetical protein